jgi:hypothetical protein
MRDKVAYKLKGVRKEKPSPGRIVGGDLHHDSGKWMYMEQVVDREKNSYKKIFKDPETGTVIHECEEPLDKHKGNGPARTARKKSW